VQEKTRSIKVVENWAAQVVPPAAPVAPVVAAPEPTPAPAAKAATLSHHTHSCQSENKSKTAEAPQAPSVKATGWAAVGAGTTGQQGGGGGFAEGKDDASALNRGQKW
jgi:hypothetical protein